MKKILLTFLCSLSFCSFGGTPIGSWTSSPWTAPVTGTTLTTLFTDQLSSTNFGANNITNVSGTTVTLGDAAGNGTIVLSATSIALTHVNGTVALTGSGGVTASGFRPTYTSVTKTSGYTLTSSDYYVRLNGATLTATLPTAVGIAGKEYLIKLVASGTTGTVATTSAQTIDGSTTYSLSAQYKYVRVISTGSNWDIIGNN